MSRYLYGSCPFFSFFRNSLWTSYFPSTGSFFGWNIFIPYYLSGLPYDIMHAVGNVVFFVLLYPIVMRIFHRADKNSQSTN